jgi:hypothetical protein
MRIDKLISPRSIALHSEPRNRLRTGLFCALVCWLLLVNGVPAVDAWRQPQRYIDYQNNLIESARRISPAMSRLIIRPWPPFGVCVQAGTKLIACGFVLVLMWKGLHRRPARAMILLITFLSVVADPTLAAFLARKSRSDAVRVFLSAAEAVFPLIAASLLRFAVLFPRPLSIAQLLPHLSATHPGPLRRAYGRAITAGRHHLSRTALLQVAWADAAVLLMLIGFLAVRRPAGWPLGLNSYLFGAAIVFATTRLAAATFRIGTHSSRGGVSVPASRQIAPVLIGIVATALLIQPTHRWVDSAARLVLVALLIRGGIRRFSRLSFAIRWFEAAIVFALATFMFVTRFTDWAWRRNSEIGAAAAVIVVARLVATALRSWIRRRRGDSFSSRPVGYAGSFLIASYAVAVVTQRKWTSGFTELIIFILTIVLLPWMLSGTLRSSFRFSDVQLKLTRPFPVWSAALIAHFVYITSMMSLFLMGGSITSTPPSLAMRAWLRLHPAMHAAAAAIMTIGSIVVATVVVVGFVLLALKFLRIGYEVGDATDRQRMLWIVEGVAAFAMIQAVTGAAVIGLSGVVPGVLEHAMRLSNSAYLPLILLSFGVAVFYHGAIDPSLIIRRTVVLGAVAFISVCIFEALENLISAILSVVLGAGGAPKWLTFFIAGGIVALALEPVRRRCDAIIARYLPAPSSGAAGAEQRE